MKLCIELRISQLFLSSGLTFSLFLLAAGVSPRVLIGGELC